MTRQLWNRLRKDEYVFNDKVFRMTKEKAKKIARFDKSLLNDKRYA